MVDIKSGSVLNASLRAQLLAIRRTQRGVDETQTRLASGLAVNSALDNPQNFFTAQSLSNRASDLSKLLDGINSSLRTIEEATHGVEAISKLLDQAETVVDKTREELESGLVFPNLTNVEAQVTDISQTPLNEQIIAAGPVAYYRLNGNAVESTGNPLTFDGTFENVNNAGAPLYSNGAGASADFNGVGRVLIPDSDLINLQDLGQKTVELVFQADNTSGRQILYEEGGTQNGFAIYINNGTLHITAEDDKGANRFFDLNINAPVVAGQTYHVAFVFDRDVQRFRGYLDGIRIGQTVIFLEDFPSHSDNIGIGGINQRVQFHDGESAADDGLNFNGRISDVAIYDTALSESTLFQHADSLDSEVKTEFINTEYERIIDQIDQIVEDANYRGVNLLLNESLRTFFNENRSNFLDTEGVDFTYEGLGLERVNFSNEEEVDLILQSIRDARDEVRNFGRTLTNDYSILQTREDFTRETITNLRNGARDLTIADQNEEGANLLALQVRQQIQFSALALRPLSIADFLL